MDLGDRPEPTEDACWKRTRLADEALTQGTRKVYDRAVACFDEWRGGRPASDVLLADYLGVLFERGMAPATASVVVAAVEAGAKRRDALPLRAGLTDQALSGFRRNGADRGVGQVGGLSWEQVDDMADLAKQSANRPAGLRDALLLRIASDCLLRVAEASALDIADIAFEKDWLRVVVRRSKTDQEGKGAVLYAGPPTRYLAGLWLETAGMDDGPLFRPVNKVGRVASTRLSARSMREIIRRRAGQAGIIGRVSGHSLRVGAAQSLRDAGATTPELLAAGRWKRVETMAHYTSAQEAEAGPVARLRYGVEVPNGGGRRRARSSAASPVRSTRRGATSGEETNGVRRAAKRLAKAARRIEKRLARLDAAMVASEKADLRNQTQFIGCKEFYRRLAKFWASACPYTRDQRNASSTGVFLRLRARYVRLKEGPYLPDFGLVVFERLPRVRSIAARFGWLPPRSIKKDASVSRHQ